MPTTTVFTLTLLALLVSLAISLLLGAALAQVETMVPEAR